MLSNGLLLIAAVFGYLLIGPYFPSFIFTAIFITLATLVIRYKKDVKRIDRVLYLLTLITALTLTLRANGILLFLNFFASIYLGCYLILDDKIRNRLNIFQLISLPLFFTIRLIRTENKLPIKVIRQTKIQENGIAVLITILILLLIIPLLSSANPIFKNWVDPIVNLFNYSDFFKKFFSLESLPPRLIFFVIMAFFFPRIISYLQVDHKNDLAQELIQLSLIIPKIIISAVLVIFFISQAQLYFADANTLKSLSLTHSQYAREVFAQLSLVSVIILSLIYFDRNKTKLDKRMTMILLIEGIFLTLMAFKSDFDYTSMFGFTHKRLYGFSAVVWIIGIYFFYLLSFWQASKVSASRISDHLLKLIVFYTAAILILVNLANFDYLIYHVNPPRVNNHIDYWYLSTWNMTTDSQAYKELLMKDYQLKIKDKSGDFKYFGALSNMVWKIDRLQEEYQKFNLASFNYSQYQQYQRVKNIDLTKYKKLIETPYPQILPQNIKIETR